MVDLKFEHGWYMPVSDVHFSEHMRIENKNILVPRKNRFTYQFPKFWLCMAFLPTEKGNAIDIGSNIGLWAYNLVDFFDFVYCFEPIKINQSCWYKNLKNYNNIKLYPVALGDKEDIVTMHIPPNCTGGAYIGEQQQDNQEIINDIKVKKLDSYNLENITFIKVDVQGYELNVLKGAEKTILENKPNILVEQKDGNFAALEYLENLGMLKIFSFSGDYFMGWEAPNANYVKQVYEIFPKIFGAR